MPLRINSRSGYLAKLPPREHFQKRITELWDYPKVSIPVQEGGRYFYAKNSGLQRQAPVYVRPSLTGRQLYERRTNADHVEAPVYHDANDHRANVRMVVDHGGGEPNHSYAIVMLRREMIHRSQLVKLITLRRAQRPADSRPR